MLYSHNFHYFLLLIPITAKWFNLHQCSAFLKISVSLTAMNDSSFKGFLLQARAVGGDTAVGMFQIITPNTQGLVCNNIQVCNYALYRASFLLHWLQFFFSIVITVSVQTFNFPLSLGHHFFPIASAKTVVQIEEEIIYMF